MPQSSYLSVPMRCSTTEAKPKRTEQDAQPDSDTLTILDSDITTTEHGDQQPESISRTLTPRENFFDQDPRQFEHHDILRTDGESPALPKNLKLLPTNYDAPSELIIDTQDQFDIDAILTETTGHIDTNDHLFFEEFNQFQEFDHFRSLDTCESAAFSSAVSSIQKTGIDAFQNSYLVGVADARVSDVQNSSILTPQETHNLNTFDCFGLFPNNLGNSGMYGDWAMPSNNAPWSLTLSRQVNYANEASELEVLNLASLASNTAGYSSITGAKGQGESFSITTPTSPPKTIPPNDLPEVPRKTAATVRKTDRKHGRAKFDPEQKEKVKRVRQMGACMRCRIYKVECDIDDVENPKEGCSRCKEVQETGKARLYKEPCVRQDLMDVATFRMGNSKFGQHRAKHRQLNFENSQERKIIQLCFPFQKLGQTLVPVLSVYCQDFIPGEGDVLTRVWRNGDKSVEWEFPPVAIPDTDACGKAISLFLKESFDSMRGDMIAPDIDAIVSATFTEALRYSENHPESTLVHNALRIWVGTRLSAGVSFVLCGEETLGLEKLNDSSIHYDQTIPPPPVLDHQIDVIMIHHLERVQVQILKGLKKKVFQGNQKEWFEIFLTIFVLLDNLEFVFRRQLIYKRRHLESNLESTVSAITKRMMEEWEYSAKNLISHFRCVIRGPIPFTLDWQNTKKANKRRAGLDEESCIFIEKMCIDIQTRRDELNAIQAKESIGAYDYPLIWISKILLDDTD